MDISLSVRFEWILNITNAITAQGTEHLEARDKARLIENEILRTSATVEDYQRLCEEYVASEKKVEDEERGVEVCELSQEPELLNFEGPSFGSYRCATFHVSGQNSTIFKAQARNDTMSESIVALKVTNPSQMQAPHDAVKEARILAQARHDSVVPLLDSFWQHERFVLVLPFLRQDLENLLRSGSLTNRQASMVFIGLFSALSYIHSLNIIHRDIKPANILLKSMEGPVYLADFGIAWSAADSASEDPKSKIADVGTTSYRAPELLFGARAYNTSLDMWAAGCVVSELVQRDHHQLFDAGPLGSELGLIKSIFTTLGTPTTQTWPSVTQLPDWNKVKFQSFAAKSWKEILPGAQAEAVDFVRTTVCYESSQRLTAHEALNHQLASSLQRS